MAEVAKGIIDIQINTGSAAAELKALQNQINAFNTVLSKGNLGQGKYLSDYTKDLSKAINSSGVLTSEFVKMNSAASMLDGTLKKGKGSLGQFFSSAFNKNSAGFAATMELASRRAATLQTQFISTGASSKGMGEALAIRPLEAFSSKAAIAAERQSLLNNMFRQGTTQMINFGKNVQWSGRQLMVGFTVPLTVLGTVAGKTFMDIEKQLVNLRKVYGDTFTTPEEVNQNISQIRQLAEEYTKYGIAVKDTIGLAAQAAASGARNGDLVDATRQATRLATLGQMDQNEALKTTIALQSAFRLSGEELADTINFLNMVENQTVVSLQDLSAAIPRVAPVIKGLGGDVRDMSVFLAAMQEGGVSAEQGANALKSGLASLINPTKAATETLSGFGINLDKIISTNRGDLMGTVFAFGEALKGLDDFSKQQALEKVFGKYQYARLGALFENIVRDGSQASQVLNLMEYDVEALRTTAEKELAAVENALGTQLIGAVERLKLSLEPIGKIFIEIAIPIVNFLTKIVEKFDGLSDGQKKFAAIAAVIVGVVVPAGTMFLGLLINLLGTLGKLTHGFGIFGKALIKGGPVAAVKSLTQSTKYLSIEELEAAAAAKQLAGSTEIANTAMLEQANSTGVLKTAVAGLIAEYKVLISVQQQAAAFKPGYGVAGAAGAAAAGGVKTSTIRMRGLRRNSGGEIFMSGGTTVPGMGNTDTVPAMLTPGEFVINKEATAKNYALLDAINSGNKFNNGGMIPGYNVGSMVLRNSQTRNAEIRQRYLKLFGPEAQARGMSLEDRFADLMILSQQQRLSNQRSLRPQAARQGNAAVPLQPAADRQKAHYNQSLKAETVEDIDRIMTSSSTDKKVIFAREMAKVGIPSDIMTNDWARQSATINQAAKTNPTRPMSIQKTIDELIADRDLVTFTHAGRKPSAMADHPNFKKQVLVDGETTLADLTPIERSHQFTDRLVKNLREQNENSMNRMVTDEILIRARNAAYPGIVRTDTGIRTASKQAVWDIVRAKYPGPAAALDARGIAENPKRKAGWSETVNNSDLFKYGFSTLLNRHFRTSQSPLRFDKNANQIIFGDKRLGFAETTNFNKGGIAGGMQYFGGMMPNRVVAKSQIKKLSGERIEATSGHSSQFGKLAGVYDVNGRKMFVKPFATLEEAQAELIGNAARRRIAGTATPGSRIVRMDGPDGEIFATTAPMIPGMKAGTTLSTKELLKQIPASSMLGDMDATAGNILSTGGGRLVTIDPGAAGIKFKRNEKGVFRRATGNEISFGSDATNTGAYTAKAITQLIEKTGASKDYVKMLGDSIAREGLTKSQFAKMYDDAVEASIARVPSFKLPSRIGDRTGLDDLAKASGYKNADEAYSAIMLRDLTSIRGLGGDIYSSASRFQGMLKANKGTLVPEFNRGGMLGIKSPGTKSLISEMLLKKSKSLDSFRQEADDYGIKKSIDEIISNPLYHGSRTGIDSGTTLKRRGETRHNIFGADFFTTDNIELAKSYQKKSGTLRQISNIPEERRKILDLLEGGDSILSQNPQLFEKLHQQLSQQKIRFFDSDGTINDRGVGLSKHFQKTFSNSGQGKKLLDVQDQLNKINSKEYPSGMSKNEKDLKSKLEEEAKELIKSQEKYVLDKLENFKDIENMGDILLIQEGIFGKAAMHSFGRSRADLFQDDIVLKHFATKEGYSGLAHTGGINTGGSKKHNVVAFFDPEGVQLKNQGGTIVPGIGNTDTVPAMLTPGEFVVNKEATKNNFPLLQSINAGQMQGFNSGGAIQYLNDGRRVLPTFPGMPSRRARIMMGMSDPYQARSTSATGQGIFKDTSATLSSTAKKMTETFKTISAKNMVYASAGEKYFQAREAIEKKLWGQQNINKDRMLGVNTQLQHLGTAMTAAKDIVSKSSKDMGKSIMTAGRKVSDGVKNIPGNMAYKRSQEKIRNNTPEGKKALADRKVARAERMGKVSNSMMMASMIPFMASSMVEDPKQQKALMGAGAAMSIIPMLMQMGPVLGGVVAAAALVGGSFIALRKHLDNTAKAAAIVGSNLGGAANRMETVSSATGYGFASTRSGTGDFRFTEKQAQGASDIMPYFDTDEGKKLIEDMKKLSSEQRYAKIASMLTFAIADGMSPEKAEAFGSSIAFALDDALLKSKVVGLIRSGTLQSGSKSMIGEINKRQNAAGNEAQVPTVERRESLPGFSLFGLVINKIDEYVYNQAVAVDLASKAFGSSIQTLKELNNAESLLNEERSKGVIGNTEFTSSMQQINAMRDQEYKRVKATIDIGADTGAQQQAIKDQLILSGFNADTAGAVANNTTSESVAKALGFDPENLDKNQKEIVTGIIASTLDGITESNAATKIADIKDIYANMSEELLTAAADGITSAEMQDIITKSQIEKFVTSAFTNTTGMSEQQKTDKTNLMTDSISGALPKVNLLGVTTSSLVSGLSELSDPALIADITKNSDGVVKFAEVLNSLPQGWDINVAMKYFSGQNEETDPKAFFETQKEVVDKIAELLPKGSDAVGMYEILNVTTVEEAESKLKGINSQVDNLFNKINSGDDNQVAIEFASRGYDMTKKEVDAFNALPDSQQKTYLTSFIMASMQVGNAPISPSRTPGMKVEDFVKEQARFEKETAAFNKMMGEQIASNQAALGAAGIDQSPFDDSSSGGGSSPKDKEAERLNKLNDLLRERFELQQMVFDKDQEVHNNNIDRLNREIELEQRQVSLRQRGLEELSKKEEAVNDAYNLRVEALDKVSESNSRIGEQERSRISLASALASGDIASAASITSEMQQQSAQYQIEDTQAALEKQRQVDLDALTVSINGKLMTRKGIELEIEAIQDNIYNKGIEIQGVQDKLRILEDQRLVIAKEREKVETRTFLIAQRKAILDLTGKNGSVPKESKQAYDSFVASFNAIRDIFIRDNPGTVIPRLNYGGSIARMANGGIAYKGSSEPPPSLRMGTAGEVPGIGMTDKVNALLTPGEFVVRKSVATENKGFLQALNSQVFPSVGKGMSSPTYSMPGQSETNIPVNNTNVVSTSSPMYNSTYNVNVNVAGTNASPDDIANVVMAKISNQNRGNLRSNRY